MLNKKIWYKHTITTHNINMIITNNTPKHMKMKTNAEDPQTSYLTTGMRQMSDV